MKLIVGLGNPGIEYSKTRHNLGFMVIDNYALKYNVSFQKKHNGLYSKIYRNGEYYLLLKPQLYMNLSGKVIRKYMEYFKIRIEDVLVIHDDMDLPCGKIKIKKGGSSGGHNGIQNIIDEINNKDFARFKIGIDKNKSKDVIGYVLGKFSEEELKKIDDVMDIAPCIIEDFLDYDINRLMNKYNGDNHEFK